MYVKFNMIQLLKEFDSLYTRDLSFPVSVCFVEIFLHSIDEYRKRKKPTV